MKDAPFLSSLFLTLPSIPQHHNADDAVYGLLKMAARKEVVENFSDIAPTPVSCGPFGQISFPFYQMGAISSMDCFGMDELIIFSYYWARRNQYRRVLDIGANLGLHSILLAKSGYEVRAFEPDPIHFALLQENLSRNGCTRATAFALAVSDEETDKEFIRVLGNTTSSHIAGSKANPYGELEKFSVKTTHIKEHIGWADLIKLDAEGHEKTILLATDREDWRHTDCILEVSSPENAEALYEHFMKLDTPLFAQKQQWKKVEKLKDMPNNYREGSLFISQNPSMNWST